MCTKRAGSTFLLDLLSQKKMLPKYKNIAIGAKATQFHLQRNCTWSIPHKSYPSSDIRPCLVWSTSCFWDLCVYVLPLYPPPIVKVLLTKIISSGFCQSSLSYFLWDLFCKVLILDSGTSFFLSTTQSGQDLKTCVPILSLSDWAPTGFWMWDKK